ncbi:MAG: sugar ABC transporter permease [Planctomycetes bacterium]|nr:sugar ABC transporter permease [Planctomycetota bacterium]
MGSTRKETRQLATGLAFILPNLFGFLVFTLFPLVFSLIMAFTNWDLRLHNMFKEDPVRFVGFENFVRLLTEPDFFKYLGNTLFFMMGIPFGVAGSLFAAILLSQDLRGGHGQVWARVIACVGLVVGLGVLVVLGSPTTAMTLLLCGVASLILVSGALGGRTVYRTLFYFPHFTAGVATFLLWKKLYNPLTGPINNALRPVLSGIGGAVNAAPSGLVQAGAWLCAALMVMCILFGLRHMRISWRDGEMGWIGVVLGGVLLCLPAGFMPWWGANPMASWPVVAASLVTAMILIYTLAKYREHGCVADEGLGRALILCGILMTVQFALLGLGDVLYHLPAMSRKGLAPPEWLTQYHWAKPSLMIMGLWAAVGSNNMLLYLAGLSNIPTELYEAADIDGASRLQRFWHVTWPQLAPVTFFIFIMSVIGGLQGGFEMARTMTRGGPAGATTTLSYYVYTEGFETGRLGYASAIAWALFALVFAVTLFNWKFGNRYVNE